MKQTINQNKVDANAWTFFHEGKSILVKAHPKYDGYWCGVDGNIYSVKRRYLKILKQSLNKNGYLTVGLTENGKTHTCWVHILIADAWLEPSGLDKDGNLRNQINHLDGRKTNNKLCNLERNSAKENTHHFRQVLMKIAEEMLAIDT